MSTQSKILRSAALTLEVENKKLKENLKKVLIAYDEVVKKYNIILNWCLKNPFRIFWFFVTKKKINFDKILLEIVEKHKKDKKYVDEEPTADSTPAPTPKNT